MDGKISGYGRPAQGRDGRALKEGGLVVYMNKEHIFQIYEFDLDGKIHSSLRQIPDGPVESKFLIEKQLLDYWEKRRKDVIKVAAGTDLMNDMML